MQANRCELGGRAPLWARSPVLPPKTHVSARVDRDEAPPLREGPRIALGRIVASFRRPGNRLRSNPSGLRHAVEGYVDPLEHFGIELDTRGRGVVVDLLGAAGADDGGRDVGLT
jgi:hypothetical protein